MEPSLAGLQLTGEFDEEAERALAAQRHAEAERQAEAAAEGMIIPLQRPPLDRADWDEGRTQAYSYSRLAHGY